MSKKYLDMKEKKDIKSIFANNLRNIRRQVGFSNTLEPAKAMGVSKSSWDRWEQAASMPDVATLVLIADVLGVTVNDLTTPRGRSTVVINSEPEVISMEMKKVLEDKVPPTTEVVLSEFEDTNAGVTIRTKYVVEVVKKKKETPSEKK